MAAEWQQQMASSTQFFLVTKTCMPRRRIGGGSEEDRRRIRGSEDIQSNKKADQKSRRGIPEGAGAGCVKWHDRRGTGRAGQAEGRE